MSFSLRDTADLRARRLIAVQARNAAAGCEALALRTGADSLSPADLSAAGVVRSWSQRSTHHYLPARDVGWITLLCSPRVQRASAKRRGLLGLTDADVDLGRTFLPAGRRPSSSTTPPSANLSTSPGRAPRARRWPWPPGP